MRDMLVDAGHRVIAPDMIGTGQSDKSIEQRYHDFERHVANSQAFIEALELRDITLLPGTAGA